MLPFPETQSGWRSALEASGGSNLSEGDDGPVERLAVSEFLAFDRTNSSSILSCLEKARQNARSVRTALTRECFETLNEAWLRSEEHTSELQSLMRISYAVFCLKKKN